MERNVKDKILLILLQTIGTARDRPSPYGMRHAFFSP